MTPPTPEPTPDDAGDSHAHESIEHLRSAAHELIAAARAALDAAEEFVDNPDTKSSLNDVADVVTSFFRSVVPGRRPVAEDDLDDDESAIERIEIL